MQMILYLNVLLQYLCDINTTLCYKNLSASTEKPCMFQG